MRLLLLPLLLVACERPPPDPDPAPDVQPSATLASTTAALDQIEAYAKQDDVEGLKKVAMTAETVVDRGRAVQALSQIRDPKADDALEIIQTRGESGALVQTWAAAARIQRAEDLDTLVSYAAWANTNPALQRPLKMKFEALSADGNFDLVKMLTMYNQGWAQSIFQPLLIEAPVEDLVGALYDPKSDNGVRQTAASFLATRSRTETEALDAVLDALDFEPEAEKVPWDGGALFIPASQYSKRSANRLIEDLVAWHLFCQTRGLTSQQQQIYNNLRSINLLSAAGMQRGIPQDTDGLLIAWGQHAGERALVKMLEQQRLSRNPHYKKLIERLRSGR